MGEIHQLTLEEILQRTKDDLWDVQQAVPMYFTYKYLLTTNEAQAIIDQMRALLHKPSESYFVIKSIPSSEESPTRFIFEPLLTDEQKALQEFAAEAIQDGATKLGDFGILERLKKRMERDASTLQEYARTYIVEPTSDESIRSREKLEKPPGEKKVLIIKITDASETRERLLLTMNAFYAAYTKVKGISQQEYKQRV